MRGMVAIETFREFAVHAGMAHRKSIIGGGNEGDSSSALGGAEGSRF